jgi:uncharacterized membrane protein YphA (DoxX/SURF4 family)
MNELFLLGRIVFGGFFTYNGVNHFTMNAAMVQYAGAKGVPMPEAAVMFTGFLLLVGGVSIVLGWLPHIGALCIAIFLLGVTPMMHDFWAIPDAGQRMTEMGNFAKNIAMLGGVLMLMGVPRPWPYSVERRRRRIVA